ncbi:MAG: hypothetical protein JNK58_12115 [Phycisphaerae bacterium]|nr:hypothetical protein [Phycisphaerae bacterium]
MDDRPTEADGRRALRDHVLERAHLARSRYGPVIDAEAMLRALDDRAIVRYPVVVRFAAEGLEPGEMAHAAALGEHPKDGFSLLIHPSFEARRDSWALIIAYHIPPMNYGDIVEPEDCEAFGAAMLGLDVETYYEKLCALADSIG